MLNVCRSRALALALTSLSLKIGPQVLGFSSVSMSSGPSRVVDAHLHVWSSAVPYASPPPEELGDEVASAEALLKVMDQCGVAKAVIVQPANYAFDHTYVLESLRRFPDRFAVNLLLDPKQSPEAACEQVRSLAAEGCCGIRFNPYLWPEGEAMDNPTGAAVYRLAGELGLPVGVMAFKGLPPLAPALRALAKASPETRLILDHWGFPRADPASPPSGQAIDEEAWNLVLALAEENPQLFVKVSALFRVSGSGGPEYADLRPRFEALLAALGARRLLYGSDFPYVQLQTGGYGATLDAVRQWTEGLAPEDRDRVLGGTATELFQLG